MSFTSMTISPFREKYKHEIRTEILRLAREHFVHEGYGGFSMRRLAEQVGCVPSAIYKHFANKAEVFDCLIEESFAVLMRASGSVEDLPGEDPIQRLKRGMRAYVVFGLENPDHYRFAFVLQRPNNNRSQASNSAYEGLKSRIGRCIAAGYFPDGNADMMAQSLWAPVHGITSLLIQRPSFPWADHEELITRIIDAAVSGLMEKTAKRRQSK
jgi:AcrR family transcriptional regulator